MAFTITKWIIVDPRNNPLGIATEKCDPATALYPYDVGTFDECSKYETEFKASYFAHQLATRGFEVYAAKYTVTIERL